MTTSPSPTVSPQFFQRKPTQVQAVQWPIAPDPEDVAASAEFTQSAAAIFTWVTDNGGRIAWRDTGEDFFPAIVTDAGDIPIASGDWIVRLPGHSKEDGSFGESRWIAETIADFENDYQHQMRAMRGGLDVMAHVKKVAQLAEVEEATMTLDERREASRVETQRLGNVVNQGGGAARPKIRDLRSGE